MLACLLLFFFFLINMLKFISSLVSQRFAKDLKELVLYQSNHVFLKKRSLWLAKHNAAAQALPSGTHLDLSHTQLTAHTHVLVLG